MGSERKMAIIDETEKAELEAIPVPGAKVEVKTGADGQTKRGRGRPPKDPAKAAADKTAREAAKKAAEKPKGKLSGKALLPEAALPIVANFGINLVGLGVQRKWDIGLPPPPPDILQENTDNLRLLVKDFNLEMHPALALLAGNGVGIAFMVGTYWFEKVTRPSEEIIEKKARAMAAQMAAQQRNGVVHGDAGAGTSADTVPGSGGEASA